MNFDFRNSGARAADVHRALAPSIAPGRERKRASAPLVQALVRVTDLVVIGGSGAITYLGAALIHDHTLSSRYLSAIGVTVFLAAVVFEKARVYQGDYLFSRPRRVERVVAAWAATAGLALVAAFSLGLSESYARPWAVGWFIAALCLLVAARIYVTGIGRDWAGEGRFADRTVIVGAGPQGVRLAEHLERYGDIRTHILGFVDDRRSRILPYSLNQPLLGSLEDLLRLIRENTVDQVFIALPWTAESRLREIALEIATTPVRVHLAPDLAGFQFPDRPFSQIGRIPMLHLFDRPISGADRIIKAVEDYLIGGILTLLFLPLMGLIAIAIKLDSPGPVFFRQAREGFNNNLFKVWKFRSMYTDMADANCQTQTTKDDPRVTRVGRILRKTSLDELPQLFNVLTGDMSLVGPRPHATGTKSEGRLFEDVVDRYAARHRVKPGITGWAQVNGWRGETDTAEKIERRVEHDLYYIDNWSPYLDLKILVKTVTVVFKNGDTY